MAISSVVKNFRDGTILIEDGTGVPIDITVQFENGDFSLSGLNGFKEVTTYMDRGDLGSVRHTTQSFPTGSFSAHLTDISDGTDNTLIDAARKQGSFASAVSTLGADAEVMTYKVTWTVEGTDHGDTAVHTIVCDDCYLSIDVSEGDPSSMSMSFTVYGAVTMT